jgi:hypothetical protein
MNGRRPFSLPMPAGVSWELKPFVCGDTICFCSRCGRTVD